MVTLKQMEALHWIAQLGTFERAAQKLYTSQSAISKRVHELEEVTGVAIFDRSRRGATLTDKGEDLLAIARQMLQLEESIGGLAESDTLPARRLRIGLTEMSTMTWFPRLISALGKQFPTLSIQPDVDTSRDLYSRLNDEELDLIVIPEVFSDPALVSVPLVKLESCWIAQPGLVKEKKPLTPAQLIAYPLIAQGRSSGTGMLFNRWLRSESLSIPRLISCDNIIAVLGLTVAGMGIGSAPYDCCRQLIKSGQVKLVKTTLSMPPVTYAAMYKADQPHALISKIVKIIGEVCDFSLSLRM